MEDGARVVIKQTRSEIGRTQRVRDTLGALGLGRIGKSREVTLNPAIRGMIRKVRHLLSVTAA